MKINKNIKIIAMSVILIMLTATLTGCFGLFRLFETDDTVDIEMHDIFTDTQTWQTDELDISDEESAEAWGAFFADLEELDISNEARTIGTNAVQIADQFLDGNIERREASDRIHELPEIQPAEFSGDLSVRTRILSLSVSFFIIGEPTDEDIQHIINSRNSLAERIGLPIRN